MILNRAQTKVTPYEFAKRIANRPAFKLGYDSVMKNVPYNYDIIDDDTAIAYARGRMFAIWCKQVNAPRAVWRGAVPAKTLVERIAYAAKIRGIFV
jgi:hypothetical protein